MYKKHLGQNFLKSDQIADKIIAAADLTNNDMVLEVGPGTGILTERLVKVAKEVWAIEKDYDLVTKLQKAYKKYKNLKIIHQDILWFDLFALSDPSLSLRTTYKVVANIPYNITSPLIRKFLNPPAGGEPKPELMVLMVQKEVAERICAKPGDSARGLLTIIVEFYADAEILFEVSRKEFYPQPKVDSSVIKIITKKQDTIFRNTEIPRQTHLPINKIDPKAFFHIVKAGFSRKRAQIHNSLAATLRLPKDQVLVILKKAQIAPELRAEDLGLEEWRKLVTAFAHLNKQ